MSELNYLGQPLADTGPGSGPANLGVNWTFTCIALLVVGLRVYVRRAKGYALDDWLMFIAAAMLIVYEGVLTNAVSWGLGKKYVSVTLKQYIEIRYWQYLAQFFLNLQPVISRWSIIIFLVGIFGKSRKWFKYLMYGWVIFLAIGAILSNTLTYTGIEPVQALWDPRIPGRLRFKPLIAYYVGEGVIWQSAISDLMLAIFPVIFVWDLKLPTRKKVGLSIILSGSLVAFVACLLKMVWTTMQIRGEQPSADGVGVLWISSGVEQSLVVILGTLPSLLPLAHLPIVTQAYGSLVYLVTRGRRSPTSSNARSEDVEMGPHKRLSDEVQTATHRAASQKDAKQPPQGFNSTKATLDEERNLRL